ncbi:integrase catalytic domain-containing protein [Trichonephila clavipes]|nr:integrase catalytic domain-containing protein [Trichonephila clavipes]
MQFWPINGKGIARKTVHDCIACFRQKPTGVDQLMGNLPSERVIPSAPFLNSGVDFCGPFQIKFKNQRKGIFSKVYVAIFVCLATKAIHLEAVTDLTTEAFIAALKRLCARRGRISTLMSDNATNFKGAAAELNRFIKLICNKNETLANYFASEAIQWKFIPPRSPNFGGLWEAGVKSFKHHLYRTLVNSKITFEEFETIIIQIEGILNSRPLVPLSDNINEYEVLTPGHFIIGRPISAIPEPAILDISDNRLSRWQYTTKCVQTIWKRWKNDYLNHLQQRNEWQFEKNNVAVGCLVLVKENDLPPCKWTMARILEVIYGTDVHTNIDETGSITRIATSMDNVSEHVDITELEVKLKKIDQLQRKIEELKELLFGLETAKPTEEAEFEEDLYKCETRLDDLEVRVNKYENGTFAQTKIPPIILPTFSGKYEQFSNFKSQFDDLITTNEQLTQSQKLYYLNSCLSNEVKEFTSTFDTFSSLYEALKSRYDNKRLIIDIFI